MNILLLLAEWSEQHLGLMTAFQGFVPLCDLGKSKKERLGDKEAWLC